MLTISIEALPHIISHSAWPFLRILALLGSAPVFSEKEVTRKFKTGLALIITFLVSPLLPDTGLSVFSIAGLLAGGREILTGYAMGLSAQLIFVAIRHAGELAGLQMGLSFATFYDPAGGQNMPVVSRLLNLLSVLLFFAFNGHLFLIQSVVDSFQVLPAGTVPGSAGGYFSLVENAGMIFRDGLTLGLPVLALMLCLNLTLGILNRLVPQLSIFVIGFPLSLSVGMLALGLIMYTLAPLFEHLLINLSEDFTVLLKGLY